MSGKYRESISNFGIITSLTDRARGQEERKQKPVVEGRMGQRREKYVPTTSPKHVCPACTGKRPPFTCAWEKNIAASKLKNGPTNVQH